MSGKRSQRRQARPGQKAAEPTVTQERSAIEAQLHRWGPWGVGTISGVLALALYLNSLAPTVTFADAGELATAVHLLDVAHAPGFPLYLLLGKLFTLLLPWGRLVQQLNAFSALCAATAVGLSGAALTLGLSLEQPRPPRRGGRRRPAQRAQSWSQALPAWVPPLLALTAAGLLAISRTFWEQATITEVYGLNMALAAGLLLLLTHYLQARGRRDSTRADRILAGAALLAGLGLGNHLTLLFLIPTIALTAWIEEEKEFWRGRRLLQLAGLFLLGLCVYLYLPIRAMAEPPFNWGDPDNLTRFWRHVSGKQYRVNFAPGWSTWIAQVRFFLPRLWHEFSPLPLILAPLGLYRLFRQRRSLAWATVISAGFVLFYALSYDIAEDQETYYMLFFLLLIVWIVQGIAQLLDWLPQARQRVGRPALAGLFLLSLLWPLLAHWSPCDRRAYTYAEDYARDVLDHLPPNAFVLTRDWNLFAPVYYLQQVEGVRPDVIWVDQELLRRTWYLDTLERNLPSLTQGAQQALEAYRVELVKFEENRPYDFATIQGRFQELGNALLEAALIQGRPAFFTPEVEYLLDHRYALKVEQRYLGKLSGQPPVATGGVGEDYIWVPRALAFQLLTEPPADLELEHLAQAALYDIHPHDELTQKTVEKYALFWLHRGMYLHTAGDCTGAVQAYQMALDIDWTLELAQQGINACGQAP